MAQVAFIASGTATLGAGGVQGTTTVAVPLITANSIVLIGTGTALNEAGAGVHLVSVIDAAAHTVTFSSVDEHGAVVPGDVYSFNYVILAGGNIDSDITAEINAHKAYLEDGNALNQAASDAYLANLNAQKDADVAIEAANAAGVAAAGVAAGVAAAAAAAAVNNPIEPGGQRDPFPYPTAQVDLKKKLSAYTNDFFNYDAIGKNHNGVTNGVSVPFGAAGHHGGAAGVRTMTGFYNQITTGDPLAAAFANHVPGSLRDALKYYMDETDDDEIKPYLRYKMPVYHFRAVAARAVNLGTHYVEILPTSRLPYFTEAGTLHTDIAGAEGPIPNSFEARSLQYDFDKGRIPKNPKDTNSKIIRKITSKFGNFQGYTYGSEAMGAQLAPRDLWQVPIRILPNFLHGCCIRTSQPTTELYRPLANSGEIGYADVWCKIYPSNTQPLDTDGIQRQGCRIPYNKDKIHITEKHYLVERWDGVVLFVNETTNKYVDMPVGCVMVGSTAPLNNDTQDAQEWMTTFLPAITATRNLFLTAATAAAVLGEMFPTARPIIPNVLSHAMGLAMYVFRLRLLGGDIPTRLRAVRISGGYTKKNITKKTRNMNKRQRRSKSKSMSMLKSAKRTFYRTNKRNKTSRQYH